MATIPVILDDSPTIKPETLGVLTQARVIKNIDVGKIRTSLADRSGQISAMLQDIKAVGDFKLKEVQVAVEVSAEGSVALIGSISAGAKGAITLTFSA